MPGEIIAGTAGPFTFVATRPPGSYIVTAKFTECGGLDAEAPLTVTAASTTTTPLATVLPATGRTTDGLVWLALATLLLGCGLVKFAARRS